MFFCSKELTSSFKEPFKDNSLSFESWLVVQWKDLISSKSVVTDDKEVAIKLLYVSGKKSNTFNIHNSEILNRDYMYKMLRILADKTTETFGIGIIILLNLLWKLDLTVKEFLSLKIPESFITSLNEYFRKKPYIRCVTPWCKHINSIDKLVKVKSIKSKTHHSIHLCLGCCVKFGINKVNENWEEYGDLIHLGYKGILPLINMGHTKLSISKKTGISRYKIYKFSSYFARYKLISKQFINTYTPNNASKITSTDLIEIATKNESRMRLFAQKKLNISSNDFYYYYYEPKVQFFLYSNY